MNTETDTAHALDRELAATLRAHDLRVTSQRLILHRRLRERRQHLTAEQAQRAVGEQLPGVSAQTIYSTLELFERLGIVRRVPSPTGATLFDSRADPHHHLSCRSCGTITDLDADVDCEPALAAAACNGFAPDGASVTVAGLCADCAGAPPSSP